MLYKGGKAFVHGETTIYYYLYSRNKCFNIEVVA